jgi:transposase, IS5 family
MVGARSFRGNPYDGHTSAEPLEQANTLLQDLGVKPTTAAVDLGFRGVDEAWTPLQIIHRGKFKSLDAQQSKWLKRRQAIEPAIGDPKSDHHKDRCWLQGAEGDALHAVLCAAGFNIHWLPRAIAAKALRALVLVMSHWSPLQRSIALALHINSARLAAPTRMFESRASHASPGNARRVGMNFARPTLHNCQCRPEFLLHRDPEVSRPLLQLKPLEAPPWRQRN